MKGAGGEERQSNNNWVLSSLQEVNLFFMQPDRNRSKIDWKVAV